MKVTSPAVPGLGVQSTVKVAGSPALRAVCVASDQPLVPATTRMLAELGPPTAKVPCLLDRRLKPAAPGLPFGVVTVRVSVTCAPTSIVVALAVSETAGAMPPLWQLIAARRRCARKERAGETGGPRLRF